MRTSTDYVHYDKQQLSLFFFCAAATASNLT